MSSYWAVGAEDRHISIYTLISGQSIPIMKAKQMLQSAHSVTSARTAAISDSTAFSSASISSRLRGGWYS